ncbi:MAG: DUF3592 domain-containing protein [Streptosporangiaceae bacterium]|jgi:hypothetical protein
MPIAIGVWFALAGAVAAVAGLSGLRRSRQLRRDGLSAWAVAVPPAVPAGEPSDGSPRRTLIQYSLPDGRVVERIAPGPARKAAALRPGQQVLVWYDPEDPEDVIVYGREGRTADRVFVAVGVLFMLIGTGIAVCIS